MSSPRDHGLSRVKRKHTKSKVGCPQCRAKKIKCDESLPACWNCVNRSTRCGYLDYDAKQVDLIKLAHWEAAGSLPGKIPIKEQKFNPTKPLVVMNRAQSVYEESSAQSGLHPLSLQYASNDPYNRPYPNPYQSNPYHINSQYLQYPPYPVPDTQVHPQLLSQLQISQYQQNLPNLQNSQLHQNQNLIPNTFPICSINTNAMPYIIQNNTHENQPYSTTAGNLRSAPISISISNPSSKSKSKSKSKSQYKRKVEPKLFEIALVSHRSDVSTAFNVPYGNLFSYFGESNSNAPVRLFILETIKSQIKNGPEDETDFSSALIFGSGALLPKHPDVLKIMLKCRGFCIKNMLSQLKNLNDLNSMRLCILALQLDITTTFIPDSKYTDHFTLATGSTSILNKIFQNPSKFPTTLPFAKCAADCLLSSAKSVWVPQYNYNVLFEFYDIVKDFGKKFITRRNKALYKHHTNLVEYIEFCVNMFQNESSEDLALRYPIDSLFQMVQKWFAILPSECMVLDSSNIPAVDKVFYSLWIVLLKQLESIVNACRYAFSFFLDGLFFLFPFRRETIDADISKYSKSKELQWFFNYNCRVISFFDKRMKFVMGNTMLNDPFPTFLNVQQRLKARPLDIHEKHITSFKNTIIKKIHYPTESTNFNTQSSLLSIYYKSSELLNNDNDIINELDVQEDEDPIDLTYGIDFNSSFLSQDYKPDTSKIQFTFQEATAELLQQYMEDRKMIVYQSIEGQANSYSY